MGQGRENPSRARFRHDKRCATLIVVDLAAGTSATEDGGGHRALATLLRDQPLSPGKVSLALRAVVGGAVASVTTVALDPANFADRGR